MVTPVDFQAIPLPPNLNDFQVYSGSFHFTSGIVVFHLDCCWVINSDDLCVLGALVWSVTWQALLRVNVVCAKCFFQVRQLRRIWCSLDDDSVAKLVHAFVTSRVDYSGSLLTSALKKNTNKLLHVLNSAAQMSRIRTSSTEDSLVSGEVSYTGWMLSTGFGLQSAFRCPDPSVASAGLATDFALPGLRAPHPTPPIPFPPVPPPSPLHSATLSPLPLPSSPLPPLRSRPLQSSKEVWGSDVSSPRGVWGRAPAEIKFGAF